MHKPALLRVACFGLILSIAGCSSDDVATVAPAGPPPTGEVATKGKSAPKAAQGQRVSDGITLAPN